ncbi:hypothetical protein MEN41_09975 [Dolichospermum sp. ST_con]|nr:hypothetical protein [Dolichospermum sp. ST_con]MDD1422352.1 hypothetical protein [Dolichospermum sp. ST_sed1]MDD1423686.1 hypothetical protein [Dolichospermum sp. ST_sed9]MDD1434523.1 hypothetical protein [Dolichospermum sp. ST_sed6]MDD1435810.1 hypothetical protein [Dolichospermum sp. ST_sed10]MDD1461534.1 hypothetical protein [Dolichospermum sp. ST_sed2]MDD1468568.1 hypothetical protein [Dolichospermum sp. ST_sed5]MDD1472607.1 hypothetical protein [Dolichospermum sp. ST_sed4]
MNRFTRSSIALAALTLASVLAFTSKASADTAQLKVETKVPSYCAFDAASLTPGALGKNFTNNTLDSTDTTNGGIVGSVDLTCNNPGSQLAIASVTFTQPTGASANLTSQLVTVTHPDGSVTYNGANASDPVSITSLGAIQNVKTDAKAVYSAPLIAGDYAFTINLTATP